MTTTNAETTPVWAEATVPLMFPLDGGRITSITLKEPDGETLEKIEAVGADGTKLKTAQNREIISLLSGVPMDVLKKINGRDLVKVNEAVGPLLVALIGEEDA